MPDDNFRVLATRPLVTALLWSKPSKERIASKWNELSHALGDPLGEAVAINKMITPPIGTGANAMIQVFRHGMLVDTGFKTPIAVYGAIYQKYVALGRENSFLGLPQTDELPTFDNTGRYNKFENGEVYWSQDSGAHEVHGAILEKWKKLSRNGQHLGLPTTDETSTNDGVGRFNHFQGGTIFWHPQHGAHEVHGDILKKWAALGYERGVLGYPVTDETSTLDKRGRFNHFQSGSIFWTPKTGAHETHGAIHKRWATLGFERSYLGFPISDEENFPGGGRASSFENGGIYWWRDTGAIDLRNVVVHYTGLICFGETDWDGGSDSDEPYALIGVVSPVASHSFQTQIYEDVDGGESRPDLLEIYRGRPFGINISALLMEHDHGDPNKYRDIVKSGVQKSADLLKKAVALIPKVGPALALVAEVALPAAIGPVTDAFNEVLGTGDDVLGQVTIQVSAKQMVILATRTPNSSERGVGYKLATNLISAQGASYKLYFGVVPA